MAEGTYEFECMRSELLGIGKPNEEEFEKARAERLKAEQAELDAAEAELLEKQEESMQNVGGKLDELNSILSSTQKRINRLKQTARGSITSMFSRGSIDDPTVGAGTSSSSASSSRRNTATEGETTTNDINEALNNLDEMQKQEDDNEIKPIIPTERITAKLELQKKMTSHLDKLDTLINKSERAELAMSSQTQQMRRMAK